MKLKEDVDNDIIHMPKECMVMSTASNSLQPNVQPVLIWPTCSKNEVHIQANVIRGISDQFKTKTGAPLLCWSTDGDSTRRQIFDHLMNNKLENTSPIYAIISKLRFIDLNVGKYEETVDFDGKHLAKRWRNYFIGSKSQFGESFIYRRDLKKILKLSPIKPKHSIKELINPRDKQNVALATEFLFTLSQGLRQPELKTKVSIRIANMADDLKHYADVLDGILCLYATVEDSISQQLEKISTASFKLLCLYRKLNGKVIPTQLYHDLMCTFENCFYAAAKFQVHHPDLPLWLMLLGTDVLERLFGNMRQKNKSGFDALDMIYMSRSMAMVSAILDSHPDWVTSGSKLMTRLCLDYSKPSNWDITKLTLQDVDIPALWERGRQNAQMAFLEERKCDFFDMNNKKVTLLMPDGKRKVGLQPLVGDILEEESDNEEYADSDPESEGETNVSVTREEANDVSCENDADAEDGEADEDDVTIEDEKDTPTSSIIDYVAPPGPQKYDNQILIEGEYFFKASVVRQTFDSSSGSNDRLKRVKGMSKYKDDKENESLHLDNVAMIGDPLLVRKTIAIIIDMKYCNKKLTVLDGEKLRQDNVILTVRPIELTVHNEHFVWTGEFKGGKRMKVAGSECNMLEPDLLTIDGKSCFAFDRSFIADMQTQELLQGRSDEEPPAKKKKGNQANQDVVKKECAFCGCAFDWSKLRIHVGKHIINGDIKGENVCGYCGGTCYTALERSTKTKGNWLYKPNSRCKLFWAMFRKPGASTPTAPCSNFVEHCKVCGESVWFYNMGCHYSANHSEHEDVPVIGEEEKKNVRAFKGI